MRFHWFHRWEELYCYTVKNGRAWFAERRCRKCGKTEIVDHVSFSGSFTDAIHLGIAEGFYKALRARGCDPGAIWVPEL